MKKLKNRVCKLEKRTDLALECFDSADKTALSGVKVEEDSSVTTVTVLNEEGAKAIGKPVGKYVTCRFETIANNNDIFDGRIDNISSILKSLLPDNMTSVLVAGIGNLDITADALGPMTNDYILSTRHLKNEKFFSELFCVSSISTGVLGDTGIESAEIVKGVVDVIKPSCVIAVDALAASSVDRLGTTVQLSDTGIAPGSGVGNHRYELSMATLGVPVISLGIPTVVSTSVINNESSDELMFVTPREIDKITDMGAKIIGMAINTCFQKTLTPEEIFSLLG